MELTKTKNIVLVGILVGVLMFALCGCSSPSTSENNNTNTTSSAATSDYTNKGAR